MEEVCIPTDQIPVEIMQRLQAIVDYRSLLLATTKETGITPISALPQLTTPTVSSSTYAIPSGANVSNSMAFFGQIRPSSSSASNGSSEPVLSFSNLSSSKSVYSTTVPQYVSHSSIAKFGGIASAASDEVDGGPRDSYGQISGPSPQKRKIVEALDDSGIVRVFPAEDPSTYDHKSSSDQTSKSQSSSEIVRIFPDVDTTTSVAHEATIIRAKSPILSHSALVTCRSESVHVFSSSRDSSPSSRAAWQYQPSTEFHSQSPRVSSSQGLVHQTCDKPTRRPGSVSHVWSGHYDFNDSPNHMASVNKRDACFSRRVSQNPSPVLQAPSNYVNDQDKNFSSHLISSFSVNARRSPELPTPPQTPDEIDVDVDDDEVFTYNIPGCDDLVYRSQTSETNRKMLESTPRRGFVHLRHNSDRSCEQRQRLTNPASSAGPAQKMSEMSFGDRHKTRKRLSFDEDMASQSPSQRPHHHSDPTTVASSPAPLHCIPPTSSSLQTAAASRKCHTGPIMSPAPVYHSPVMSSPFNICRPSPNKHTAGMHQPNPTSHVQKSQSNATPMSAYLPSTNKSPVHDVFTILERAVCQQTRTSAPRGRLHSEGDSHEVDGCSLNRSSCGTSSPTQKQYSTRRQTFSHGKRRRRDQEDSLRTEENAAKHVQVTWSSDPSNGSVGDCACSKIARNFLQMVEGAYKSISLMDGTQAGLGRFRQELAQTNDILRESLNIVQQFRSMCEHNGRSLSDSLATPTLR